MSKDRVRIRRTSADKAERDAWKELSVNCPWRSEKHFRGEGQELPGRCLAIRESAWLQECSMDKCAPYYFTLKGQYHGC